MNDVFEMIFLTGPQNAITASYGLLILSSLFVGAFSGRRGPLGLSIGYLCLIAGGDLSLYGLRALQAPIELFVPVSIILALTLSFGLRRFFFSDDPDRDDGWTAITLFGAVFVSVAFWLIHIVSPNPASGFMYFQGWTPLYIEESIQQSRFVTVEDFKFGVGALTAGYYYPLDLTGIATLVALTTGLSPHAGLASAAILGATSACLALMGPLTANRWAVAAFSISCVILLRLAPSYSLVLGNNWGDVTLYLAGAVGCAVLCGRGSLSAKLPAAALLTCFAVFSRNFGAFYGFFLGLFGLVMLWHQRQPIDFKRWGVTLGTAVVLSANELVQTIVRGPYFPRTRFAEMARDWGHNLKGMAIDLGLIPDPSIFKFGIPYALSWLPLLVVVLYWSKRQNNATGSDFVWRIVSPLAFVAAPVVLELITGYRQRTEFSKLYILSVALIPWYPVYLLVHMPVDSTGIGLWIRDRKRALTVVVGGIMIGGLAMSLVWLQSRPIFQLGLGVYVKHAFESYENNNHDLMIARQIAADYPDRWDEIKARPIMYFHQEPGISLRLFLGGNFAEDYDFWSVSVQKIVRESATMEEVLARLNYPSLYLSYGYGVAHAEQNGFHDWEKFQTDLEEIDNRPWVDAIVTFKEAKFVMTRPSKDR